MQQTKTEHKTLFHLAYDREAKNYDHVLAKLGEKGATKYDCVALLTQELNLPATEADHIVHNSPVWGKSRTNDVFSGFFDFCENVRE